MLVKFQKEATGDDRYILLDLLQAYVGEKKGRTHYKKRIYSAVRSFFMHNRAELPRDKGFKVKGEKPKVVGNLNIAEIRRVAEISNPTYRALFLCMFQAGMGWDEALYWNETGLESTREQLRAGTHPLRIDLPGRKQVKYIKPYYTFIGRDGIEALNYYLKIRPDIDEIHIFFTARGTPLNYEATHTYWLRKLRRCGFIVPRKGGGSIRYGKNLHEIRDVFKTRFHKSRADLSAADFFMGHDVDPLEYDKVFRDKEYGRQQYEDAEPWLNILSETPEKVDVRELDTLRQKTQTQEKRLEELETQIGEMMPAFAQWRELMRRRELAEKDKKN